MQEQRKDSYGPLIGAAITTLVPTAAAHFAVPEGGVEFSAAALQIIAFLLGAMAAVVLVLFRLLILFLLEQNAELRRLAYRGTDTTDAALAVAKRTQERS